MSEHIIIQTPEMMDHRVEQQLRHGHADVAQYHGGAQTADTWRKLADQHPIRELPRIPGIDIFPQKLCVVDLGPGSGKPCLVVVQPGIKNIQKIILVDVSPDMLSGAEDYLNKNINISTVSVVADFLLDTDRLRTTLASFDSPKLFLCLGGTAGNFSLDRSLPALRSLLSEQDYLMLNFGTYPLQNTNENLQEIANFYTSEFNCRFGLSFLRTCGVDAHHNYTESVVCEDQDNPGVYVIRAFYRFPVKTPITIGATTITFNKNDTLQYLESRRFSHDRVGLLLEKYNLKLVDDEDIGNHGLYLATKM